ncbi:MAG: efflux RND transporter periplasmic adaptor subunit [Planctomycetes bacterium]|nr:efflux RND transporter periplasmic adaptor subunit [Planctomycetota bacterium]
MTRSRKSTFAGSISVLCVLVGLVGCKDPGDDGHGHAAGGHAGHAHDEGGAADEHAGEGEGHADEATLTPEAIARYGVKVVRASKSVVVPEISVAARVAFNQNAMAHVGTPVQGRAREVRVKVGDFVKKGDVVVVLDSPELGAQQSEFLTKHREADTAVPGVELAKNSYERGKAFYDESRGITLTELQRREAEWRAAEASHANLRTAVTAAENRLHLLGMSQTAVDALANSTEIDPTFLVTAPIDGQVIEREVTLGELVGPDRDSLLILADTRTLWVLADVPEARLPDVSIGSRARLSLPALGGTMLEGSVTFLAPEIDAATRTAPVRIEVADGKGLRPGMFAQAWIARGGPAPDPVLAIPQEAVQMFEGKPVVFVPSGHAPGEFRPQEVAVGPPVAGMVTVLEGLKDGDEYVASGSFVIKAELGKSGAAHEH